MKTKRGYDYKSCEHKLQSSFLIVNQDEPIIRNQNQLCTTPVTHKMTQAKIENRNSLF